VQSATPSGHTPEGIMPLPQRRLTVRDLISPGRMDGNSLEYIKETGFNNNAGMVAEGAAKPSSDIQFDACHYVRQGHRALDEGFPQVLDDISQLRSMIDQRLIYGLAYKEESQLLNGDNTGQNLNGIIPQATMPTRAPISRRSEHHRCSAARHAAGGARRISGDRQRHASDRLGDIETIKDSLGRYIIGNPQGTTSPTLWGLPVVATQAMTVRKFLIGAFKLGAQVFDRWDARIEVGYENDDFTKNLVTILAEERIALAVYRPGSLHLRRFRHGARCLIVTSAQQGGRFSPPAL
jgi:hypothetical protein